MKAYTNVGTMPLYVGKGREPIKPGEEFSHAFTAQDEQRLTLAGNIKERHTVVRTETVKAYAAIESAKPSEKA